MADILCALATGQKKASAVQLAAIREIADRTEGKPHQSVDLDASFSIAERLTEAQMKQYAGCIFVLPLQKR